jgi:excisionase family DNA binding protein
MDQRARVLHLGGALGGSGRVRKKELWVDSPPVAANDVSHRRVPAGEPDWLTLGQAAKYLGVAQSTIRKWSDHGRVPAFYTPGGHRRYRRGDLDRFLERSGPNTSSGPRPVVLIVDDDEKLREYVRVNLETEGYSVREAAGGEEGLRVLEESTPDLVLLDVLMPDVDGWEMLRRVQERHGVGTIPVIMFSAKIDVRSAAEAAEQGAQGFIGKPFDPQELIDQTKQLLPT